MAASLILALGLGLQIGELKTRFDYDAKAPLDVQQKLMFERSGVKTFDITYESPKGGRVTGFLTAPAGKGPFAGIVFGHWGPGDRTEFLPEAQLYSRAGAVCVMIDYPWTRPAPWRKDADDIKEPERAVELHAQAVIDLRRAVDLLLARPDVDRKRIGYVGHSYGAQFGAILAAIDRRIQTAVLVGGIPDQDSILLEGTDPRLVEYRKETGIDKIQKALETLRATAAVRYVPHAAPIPLLFQFARHERNFGQAAMDRYWKAASEPKIVRWYETGHDLNDPRALADRARWLEKHLKLGSTGAVLHQMIEE